MLYILCIHVNIIINHSFLSITFKLKYEALVFTWACHPSWPQIPVPSYECRCQESSFPGSDSKLQSLVQHQVLKRSTFTIRNKVLSKTATARTYSTDQYIYSICDLCFLVRAPQFYWRQFSIKSTHLYLVWPPWWCSLLDRGPCDHQSHQTLRGQEFPHWYWSWVSWSDWGM